MNSFKCQKCGDPLNTGGTCPMCGSVGMITFEPAGTSKTEPVKIQYAGTDEEILRILKLILKEIRTIRMEL